MGNNNGNICTNRVCTNRGNTEELDYGSAYRIPFRDYDQRQFELDADERQNNEHLDHIESVYENPIPNTEHINMNRVGHLGNVISNPNLNSNTHSLRSGSEKVKDVNGDALNSYAQSNLQNYNKNINSQGLQSGRSLKSGRSVYSNMSGKSVKNGTNRSQNSKNSGYEYKYEYESVQKSYNSNLVLVKKSDLSIVKQNVMINEMELNEPLFNININSDHIDQLSTKLFNEISEDCLNQIKFESELEFPDYSNIIVNKDSIYDDDQHEINLFNNSSNISRIDLKDSVHSHEKIDKIFYQEKNHESIINQNIDNFSTNENTNRTNDNNELNINSRIEGSKTYDFDYAVIKDQCNNLEIN
eukprot:Mrub_04656.p1 GENE.Mrub_04656~~Mrub_04656.p1  ORF type:complete len:371 (-),score=80.92 Mrub_04656:125-1195(-)